MGGWSTEERRYEDFDAASVQRNSMSLHILEDERDDVLVP